MHPAVIDLGLVDFKIAWAKQKELFARVNSGQLNNALISCRHYPVITLGRLAQRKNILISPEELSKRRIDIYPVERGGDVTYHGPGQLIIYPVFNLRYLRKDIHWFLRHLEGVVISCLNDFDVKGQRVKGLTGVWVKTSKIAAIGIAIRNWVTFHGLSLNIQKEDLINFSLIRPCGMDIMTTSVESCLGKKVGVGPIKENLIRRLSDGQDYSS